MELKIKTIKDLIGRTETKVKHNKENMRELEKEANTLTSFIKDIEEKEKVLLSGTDEGKDESMLTTILLLKDLKN